MALLVVADDEELDHVKHTLLHLLGLQHWLAILLVEVVDILLHICGPHALNEESMTLLLNPEDLLVVRPVVILLVIL